jgi:hypothetical protein
MTTENNAQPNANADANAAAATNAQANATGTTPAAAQGEQGKTTPNADASKANPNVDPNKAATPEAKPDEAKGDVKAEGDKSKEGEDKSKAAPEKYETFVLPDGVGIDPDIMGQFEQLALGLKLSQEDAQKVANLGATMAQKWANAQSEKNAATQAEWKAKLTTDAEIGGEQVKEKMAVARKVFDKFGTPELGKFLDESGLGNHPELARWAYRISKHFGEDTFVASGGGAPGQKDAAKILFPNQN